MRRSFFPSLEALLDLSYRSAPPPPGPRRGFLLVLGVFSDELLLGAGYRSKSMREALTKHVTGLSFNTTHILSMPEPLA